MARLAGGSHADLSFGGDNAPMKILVVDDERAVRESLRRALELEGYEIELAEDGAQALERLADQPEPDAMVLDVLMPGVDGLEVSRTLRRKGSKVPILMRSEERRGGKER